MYCYDNKSCKIAKYQGICKKIIFQTSRFRSYLIFYNIFQFRFLQEGGDRYGRKRT